MEQRIVPKLAFTVLENAANNCKSTHKIPPEIWIELHSFFGQTLQDAVELLDNNRITKYQIDNGARMIYKVGSKTDRFTVYRNINFCECSQFQNEVLKENSELICKHILAVKLNEITNSCKVQIETVTSSQFVEFLNEQLSSVTDY